MQLQIEDGLGLAVGKRPALDQAFLGFLGSLAAADELDDLVEMLERFRKTEQEMLAFFSLAQIKPGAAQDDIAPMVEEQAQELDQAHLAGLPAADGQQNHPERFLHLGEFVEMIED